MRRLVTLWSKCNCAELAALGCDELLRNVHRVKDEAVGRSIFLGQPVHCGRAPVEEDVLPVECDQTPGYCRWHDPAGRRYLVVCVKRKGHIRDVRSLPL